ncbi:MAG: hypothetical protein KKD44_09890 [Proteobacteria bacterium]|nr:hypothetical protein [Pseudomonadota bacterium]
MKKFKIAFFFLLIAALGIMIKGNWIFFSTKHALVVNLIYKVYEIPAIENGLYLLGFFLSGYLIASFSGLMARFHAKKKIDTLKNTVSSQMEKLSSLNKEVEFLKRNHVRPTPEASMEINLPEENTAVQG